MILGTFEIWEDLSRFPGELTYIYTWIAFEMKHI